MTAPVQGKLIAFRGDRMGGRLISLLNTMRIAKDLDIDYCVYWRDSDDLGDPTELFDSDFVRERFIDRETFFELREKSTPFDVTLNSQSVEDLKNTLAEGFNIIFDPAFGVTRYAFEARDEIQKSFKETADALRLNSQLQARLNSVRASLKKGGKTIAYHIRRGDLTADRPAMNRSWPQKFVPDEFYEQHMRANMSANARIILFSDNAEILRRYAKMFPQLQTFSSLADSSGLSDVQKDALELFTMAMVDEIIAPPSSAFSSTAKTIGGAIFYDVESQLTPQERHDALELLCHRLKNEPEFFSNEGEIGQYLVYAMRHLGAEGRRAEFIDIAVAYIEKGMNIAFVFSYVFREMFYDGQYERIVELRKFVDRGYVHFPRSFAVVAVYHGAALLMLDRKEEALRQLTSAFWHEPIEGEIDALTSFLIAQGDFDRTNFWFTDPVIERFFTNRFALTHTQTHFPELIKSERLRITRSVATARLLVWEWIDFTRWDVRSHYRYKGHFRSVLTSLSRHSWSEDIAPHYQSFTGMIHVLEGNLTDAEDEISGAILAKPDQSIFYKRLADLRLSQDRFFDSLAAIEKAIQLEPDAAMYQAYRALILIRGGDAEEGADILLPLLQQRLLQFPSLYFIVCEALRDAGRLFDAVSIGMEGLELAPMNWQRQLEIAEMQAQIGDIDGAEERLIWTLRWADDHGRAVTTASRLLADVGKIETAIDILDKAIAANPDKPQFERLRRKLSKSSPDKSKQINRADERRKGTGAGRDHKKSTKVSTRREDADKRKSKRGRSE